MARIFNNNNNNKSSYNKIKRPITQLLIKSQDHVLKNCMINIKGKIKRQKNKNNSWNNKDKRQKWLNARLCLTRNRLWWLKNKRKFRK